MSRFDWSEWSVATRLTFVLAIAGGVAAPALFWLTGSSWPIFVEAVLLASYVAFWSRDARQRGMFRTTEFGQRLRWRLLGTAIGLCFFAVLILIKALR
ncbi:MAG: hypothetical protein ACYC9X_05270 [Dehalococcoidia bacterium]